jgi:hypothetical protein
MGFKRYNELVEALKIHASTLERVEHHEGGAHQPGYTAFNLVHDARRLSFECNGDAVATVIVFQDGKHARTYHLSPEAGTFAKQLEQSKTLVTTWHSGRSISWDDEETVSSSPRTQ